MAEDLMDNGARDDRDRDLDAVMRELRSLAQIPVPAASHARIDHAVAAAISRRARERKEQTMSHVALATPAASQGRPSAPAAPRGAQRRSPAVNWLATAALLLLVVFGSLFAVGPLRPHREDHLASLSAIGTPTPTSPGEILGTVTLPAAAIPSGALSSLVWHIVAQPGGSETRVADDMQPGVEAYFVLEGAYTVQVDGPVRVIHADGTTEDLAPGTEVMVGPGEAWIDLDLTAAATFRNAGSTPVVFVGVGFWAQTGTMNRGTTDPPASVDGMATSLSPGDWAQAGPLTVTLRRVTLAPGAHLPPSAEPLPILRFVEQGQLTREIVQVGTPTASAAPLVFRADNWVAWAELGANKQVRVVNDEEEPLVFLELTITSAAADLGMPTS
jgi:hypothetical protein